VSQRRLLGAGVLALAVASFGCRKSGVECMPPPDLACPDGGGPSFEGDVLPVFRAVCDNCHAPDASDATVPFLTDYQQIYSAVQAHEIITQVFDDCAMPPANAPVPLSVDQRQTLFLWLTCGAPDSPAVDAGAGD
jgi:hypothetical protein